MTPIWMALVPLSLLPLIFHWMPVWRHNGIWFGVTVAAVRGSMSGPTITENLGWLSRSSRALPFIGCRWVGLVASRKTRLNLRPPIRGRRFE